MTLTDSDIQRFWSKVSKAPHPKGCWLWIGAVSTGGYGRFKANGRVAMAHRLSLQLSSGLPKGLNALHRCDCPACVNPDHLFPGTQKENMLDCAAKGRTHKPSLVITKCKHGHPFDQANTGIRSDGTGRKCLKCCSLAQKARRLRIKFLPSTPFTPKIQKI